MFAALQVDDRSTSSSGSSTSTTTSIRKRDDSKTQALHQQHDTSKSNIVNSKSNKHSTNKLIHSITNTTRTVSTFHWPTPPTLTSYRKNNEDDPSFIAVKSSKKSSTPALPGRSSCISVDKELMNRDLRLPPPPTATVTSPAASALTATATIASSHHHHHHYPIHTSMKMIPPYEDLSTTRIDEETVLQAVYGDDFQQIGSLEKSDKDDDQEEMVSTLKNVWNGANPDNPIRTIWKIYVRPQQTQEPPITIYSQIVFRIIITQQYPYHLPPIQITDMKNHLSMKELQEVSILVQDRAVELSQMGNVMVIELIQILEDYVIDHNHNPYLSEYEQMQRRMAKKVASEPQIVMDEDAEEEDLTNNHNTDSMTRLTNSDSPSKTDDVKQLLIEKELLRQRQALEEAVVERRRQRHFSSGLEPPERNDTTTIPVKDNDDDNNDDALWNYNDDDDDDDDDDQEIDDGNYHMNQVRGSRYLSDFMELGVLGRGGGGEVVKVKNRLDRRIYAVKKIILESEIGKFGKIWATQNRKLRREVTTISRMTHSNIVRYYQAWVEGGMNNDVTNVNDPIKEEEEIDDSRIDNADESSDTSDNDETNGNDEGDDDFVTSNALPYEMQQQLDRTDDDDSLFDYGENDDHEPHHVQRSLGNDRAHSTSVINLLERETELAHSSPLLSGYGFDTVVKNRTTAKDDNVRNSESESESDDDWDDSSVKVDSRALGKTILYIQMEYCSTTLRKLIDDRDVQQMAENGIWRLVRQILEALSYLHYHNIIHR